MRERIELWVDRHMRLAMTTLATLAGLAIATAVFLAAGAQIRLGHEVDRVRELTERVARAEHSSVQQNVNARYDDCHAGEQVRAALRLQVHQGRRTDPLLYKLIPSLDTAEVHDLVAVSRRRQLKAYAPRDCRAYALAAVPAKARSRYGVPHATSTHTSETR